MENDDIIADEKSLAEIVENSEIVLADDPDIDKDALKKDDFNLVRDALKDVLTETQKSIKNAILLANTMDDAKGYGALAQLVNAFGSLADRLTGIHEEKAVPVGRAKSNQTDQNALPGSTQNVQNQIVFTGDPAEVLRRIRNKDEDLI